MYQAISTRRVVPEVLLETGSWELKRLWEMRSSPLISPEGLLKVMVPAQGCTRKVIVCQRNLRQNVSWDTHRQIHTGLMRTLSRVRPEWYWPGMTGEIRRSVCSCEVCQAAKQGLNLKVVGKRRLQVGRVWPILAVDRVGPMPFSPRATDGYHSIPWSSCYSCPRPPSRL